MNMSNQHPLGEMRFIVKLQWKESMNPWGTLSYYEDDELKTLSYHNIVDLLFKMDSICDEQGHPQRDTILRSLQRSRRVSQSETEETNTNQSNPSGCKKLAVPIVICMRQHSSMQGYFQIRDGKHFFRSEMELMKLLLDAMVFYGKGRRAIQCKREA